MGIEFFVIAQQIVRIAIPYFLTFVGAIFSERGRVVNLAFEGMILARFFGVAVGQHYSGGSALAGISAALLCGLLTALLHAFVTVSMKEPTRSFRVSPSTSLSWVRPVSG